MVGPALDIRFQRDDVENAAVDSLASVDTAVEVGGFLGLALAGVWHPDDEVNVELSVLQDVAGAHNGLLATLGIDYARRLSRRWRGLLGLEMTYASDDYVDTYFGVDAENAARSGLDAFDADAGIKDAGLTLGVSYAFTRQWGLRIRLDQNQSIPQATALSLSRLQCEPSRSGD